MVLTPASDADPIPYICIYLPSFRPQPCERTETGILSNGEFIPEAAAPPTKTMTAVHL